MAGLEILDRSACARIAALCERALPSEGLTVEELEGALFATAQPATVRGDPDAGVVASVHAVDDPSKGFIRLLVVDPAKQRRGLGYELLSAGESDLVEGGAKSVAVGADSPYYLFAGVPTDQAAMLCLLERARYTRSETNFNMRIDLDALFAPEPLSAGVHLATNIEHGDVIAMVEGSYPIWVDEVRRALAKGTLVLTRDADGAVAGFCAFDVNRRGLVGPVGVRLDLIGKGIGEPLLIGALQRMRGRGDREVDVSWVGPIRPYARVGAAVSRTFFVYRKELSR